MNTTSISHTFCHKAACKPPEGDTGNRKSYVIRLVIPSTAIKGTRSRRADVEAEFTDIASHTHYTILALGFTRAVPASA